MVERSDWRSKTADDELNSLERPGFAWEFLRRNIAYRATYERFARRHVSLQQAGADNARRWGLVFRPGPQDWRCRDANLLAA